MPSLRFCILGTPAAGKTVFLAVLSHVLSTRLQFPRITSMQKSAYGFVADIVDQLENGEWPDPTHTGQLKNFTWLWHDAPGLSEIDAHQFLTFDCAGEDFAAIFEDDAATQNADASLSPHQKQLKAKIFDCDLVLLLVNFQTALDLYDTAKRAWKPFTINKKGERVATLRRRLEIEEAPANAIRQLRAKGITAYVIFTQEDRYHDAIQTHWDGDAFAALKEVCGKIYTAIQETGALSTWSSTVKTVNAPSDPIHRNRLPAKTKQTGEALEAIIESVGNTLAALKKRKPKLPPPIKPQPPPPCPTPQPNYFKKICMLIVIAIIAAIAFYGWRQYSSEQQRKTKQEKLEAQKRDATQEKNKNVSCSNNQFFSLHIIFLFS
ncbi:MAG: hypothetical protein LBT53_02285 [Puniceicoccales bacterium]|jgi:hypothetical protein|nr:hypothetical protein [Puniceicoccales bacterium]